MDDYIFDTKKLKVVISPILASKLCDLGHHIVKLKKKRVIDDDDFLCNTVFLFEATDEFMRDFYELTEKEKERKKDE